MSMVKSNPRIICVSGQMRCGKDAVTKHLIEKLNAVNQGGLRWQRNAFAQAIKQIVCDTFGVTMEFVEEWKTKAEFPPGGFQMTMRQMLQNIGDYFRAMKSSVWIDVLFTRIAQGGRPTVIGDSRYPKEMRAAKEHGGLNIVVWRPDWENHDASKTETSILPVVEYFIATGREGWVGDMEHPADAPDGAEVTDIFLINCGSLEEMWEKVDRLVLPHLL